MENLIFAAVYPAYYILHHRFIYIRVDLGVIKRFIIACPKFGESIYPMLKVIFGIVLVLEYIIYVILDCCRDFDRCHEIMDFLLQKLVHVSILLPYPVLYVGIYVGKYECVE